jgi:hypothetical protein
MGQRITGWREELDRWAVAASARPFVTLTLLLALNLVAMALFVATGELLFGDPAELFRELMPGTWLSALQLLFIAAIAWGIHRRLFADDHRRLGSFWALAAVFFLIFALDELTQATIFLADLLTALGAVAPEGFHDVDALLLVLLFLLAVFVLLPYLGDLLRHPAAVVVLIPGIALGVASQAMDTLGSPGAWHIVVEESLKLGAEAWLIGGFLVALRAVTAAGAEMQAPPVVVGEQTVQPRDV